MTHNTHDPETAGGRPELRIGSLRPGDHLCLIHERDAEQLEAFARFFQGALAAGERGLYLADRAAADLLAEALAAAGVDVAGERERGALVFLTTREPFAVGGRFDPGAMLDFLRRAEQEALDDDYAGLRLGVEMGWCLGSALPEARYDERPEARYEEMLGRFLQASRSVVLCGYDRSALSPRVVVAALRTHPDAVLGEDVCTNPFYEPPASAESVRVERMLAGLRQAEAKARRLSELSRLLDRQRAAAARAEHAAEHAREELLGMLAHELRNPLGTISNALGVLRLTGNGGAPWQRAIEVAERQVRRQAQVVDGLLAASQLTGGLLKLRCERLDLAELARQVGEDLRPAFAESRLDLAFHLPEASPLNVWGDRLRLAQVLGQLLENARKFTAPGGTVRLDARRIDGSVALTVADDGDGIAFDVLPHVFELFAQAEQGLDRSQGGFGVGLSIVKGLVELHGGTVTARSAGPGQGTDVTLFLPLLPEPRLPLPTAALDEEAARDGRRPRRESRRRSPPTPPPSPKPRSPGRERALPARDAYAHP
jgi:signal transduction histidine kinase